LRVTRSAILFVAVAIAAAGCAQEPDALIPLVATPNGIDNMIYGPAPVAAAATAPSNRGLMMSTVPMGYSSAPAVGRGLPVAGFVAPGSAYAMPQPNFAPAPQLAYGAAPQQSYVMAPQPTMVAAAPVAYAPAPAGYSPMTVPVGPYTLDSGDRLRIVVFGQDGLTNSYVVDASGHIAMPLIGSVLARGVTSDELANRISDQLSQGYIREPHVTVEIEAYRPFFILGEIASPGQYPYTANMTVETAVAIAGGFGPRGVRTEVDINRNIGGQTVRFAAPVTYPVRPGDTIVVKERWF
jgi:polysaccharide export outer membrane protein